MFKEEINLSKEKVFKESSALSSSELVAKGCSYSVPAIK